MSNGKFTLTLLDTSGIQEYIFNSNRLQENIGASELVYRATSLWAFQALEDAGIKQHNIQNGDGLNWGFDESKHIEKDVTLQAEVIQAAGGNTFLLFRDRDLARKFVNVLTRRLLEEAPGLTVLAQHLDEFDFDVASLAQARKELEEKMRRHKQSYLPSARIFGLAITAMCDSTGLPAVNTLSGSLTVEGKSEPLGLEGEVKTDLVSSETAAKRAWRDQANRRLRAWLKLAADDYEFPSDLEKIGRIKGDESYIAVVHADGNRMGDHVKEVAKDVQEQFANEPLRKTNREYILAMRDFSKKVSGASLAALETVVGLTVQAVKNEVIPFETNKKGIPYLPLRPLVFGGDDVTFVCNGNIGVQLAAAYLETFHDEAQKRGLNIHASAGIAIVKMHYPFARAYKLSEELAGSAKSLTRGTDCSSIDWHFAQSGLSGSLESIRRREFKVQAGTLNLRPLRFADWLKLQSVMDEFNDEYWGAKHNKVIGLREPLRRGPSDVEKYRRDYDLRQLPAFDGADVRNTGWLERTCYYFDAIELLDHYVPLKNKEVVK